MQQCNQSLPAMPELAIEDPPAMPMSALEVLPMPTSALKVPPTMYASVHEDQPAPPPVPAGMLPVTMPLRAPQPIMPLQALHLEALEHTVPSPTSHSLPPPQITITVMTPVQLSIYLCAPHSTFLVH